MKSPLDPRGTNEYAPLKGVHAHAREPAHVRAPIEGSHGDRLLSVHADQNRHRIDMGQVLFQVI